jgi:hypothetical protein
MQHHGAIDGNGDSQPSSGMTRREAIAGGGLLLGTLFLGACAGSKQTRLPGPYWSDPGAATVSNDLHSAPGPTPTTPPDFTPPSGIVPRSMWARSGVARVGGADGAFPMNGIHRITVHHDGMPPVSLASTNQVAARIEQIRESHVMGRGWADLGYHYVVDPSGRIWEGRSTRWQGAHVKNQNENNLGVLVMGNFEVQTPTSAALASLDRFIASQMQRYNIAMGAVRTHQERAPTECPGRHLQAYMIRTRSGSGQLYAMASRAGLARG